MADIELVIRIDEEDFESMKHNIAVNNPLCPLSQEEMVYKVANGVPLPKGHGGIVDVDTIDLNQDEFISQSDYYEAECAIENAPTIIEADTESEVEERKKADDSIKVGDEVISDYNVKSVVFKNDDFDNLDSMLEDLWNDTESEEET